MLKIKKYVEDIAEELGGAKHYIETALEYKAMGDAIGNARYSKYKELSMQELNHAQILHEFAVQDIERLKTVYPDIPSEMLDKWKNAHIDYVEKAAWIKQMQAM